MKRLFGALACGSVVLAQGCSGAERADEPERTGTVEQALGESVSTDKTSYAVGENVRVTWAGLPGNYYDWVTLSPAGGAPSAYVRYSYVYSRANGSVTFSSPPAGNYVARAYLNNTYTLLAESAPFTIAPLVATVTLTTNKASYSPAESVLVTYSGMAGYATDWISLSTPGAAGNNYLRWAYTGGKTSGSVSLSLAGLSGTYAVRAHFNNGFTVQQESAPFTVAAMGTAVTTNKTSYAFGENVVASFSGMQGLKTDWISFARQGTGPEEFSWWEYTNGAFSGTLQSSTLPPGTYVARAYFNDNYTLQAQSPAFTVASNGSAATVSTDKSSYTGLENPVVTYTGMGGSSLDWIGAFRPGDDSRWYQAWRRAGGVTGTVSLLNSGQFYKGTYEIRSFNDDSYVLEGTSASFTVSPAVATSKSTYTTAETVVVNAGGLEGYNRDWIAISAASSTNSQYRLFKYTSGAGGGSYTFSAATLGVGTYVARAYVNDTFTKQAESASFTITP